LQRNQPVRASLFEPDGFSLGRTAISCYLVLLD
jgi:hypothetical protein